MSALSRKPLTIGDKTARLPIIQGGMGVGISLSGLATAVANEGGIGVIAAAGVGMDEKDFYSNFLAANIRALRREIRTARGGTDGILGLNVMMANSNHGDLFETAIDEGIDIIFSGAGLPMTLPQYLKSNTHTKLVPIVSSARAAGLICRRWLHKFDYLPDAVVVEGPRAGGHLGFAENQIFDPDFALNKLIPDVLAEVQLFADKYGKPIPVVAAGGIYDGSDIHAFLAMGAGGVQMGTRFVATTECDADISFKQMYVNATKDDIVIIKSPVGMPGRAIRNRFIDDVNAGAKKPYSCPYHCISTCDVSSSPYCIAHALTSARKGRLGCGFAFAGANAYRVTEIISTKELFRRIVAEYDEAVANLAAAVAGATACLAPAVDASVTPLSL